MIEFAARGSLTTAVVAYSLTVTCHIETILRDMTIPSFGKAHTPPNCAYVVRSKEVVRFSDFTH